MSSQNLSKSLGHTIYILSKETRSRKKYSNLPSDSIEPHCVIMNFLTIMDPTSFTGFNFLLKYRDFEYLFTVAKLLCSDWISCCGNFWIGNIKKPKSDGHIGNSMF